MSWKTHAMKKGNKNRVQRMVKNERKNGKKSAITNLLSSLQVTKKLLFL